MNLIYDALTDMRDRQLAELELTADRSYRAVLGAGILRQVAFMRWCPPCRRDDHWNHERTGKPSRGPVPEPGTCWSLGNGVQCTCPWRPK